MQYFCVFKRANIKAKLITLKLNRNKHMPFVFTSNFKHWNMQNSIPLLTPHDDVIKWKHFPRYWPFVRGIHRSPVKSPHKGQWRGALTFSLICARINGWVNKRKAGDLRRYRVHYDVIVMIRRQRYWSAISKIMTRCLAAPNHYLNQCWLGIIESHGLTVQIHREFICYTGKKYHQKLYY